MQDFGIRSITYHPASAKLKDGNVVDCIQFMGERIYQSFWGIDKKRKMIDLSKVTDVFPSKYQLPPQFADKLYEVGETRMGGSDFKLVMRDGKGVLQYPW